MGSTMCKGGSLQYTLQFNQVKLPKPHKIRITYKIIQVYNKDEMYNKYKIYKRY